MGRKTPVSFNLGAMDILFSNFWLLRDRDKGGGRGGVLEGVQPNAVKFENLQIKNYIKYWENEYRTSSFSFFLGQSQHTTQHPIIKNKTESSKCLDDQGIKQKICCL